MKSAVFFSLFLAFVSCKNAEPNAEPKAIIEAQNLPTREFTEKIITADVPYKHVKKGKAVMLSKILSRYYVQENKGASDDPEAYAEQIKENTFDNDSELTFELFEGQVYMRYNTMHLSSAIPLNLVEAYIE